MAYRYRRRSRGRYYGSYRPRRRGRYGFARRGGMYRRRVRRTSRRRFHIAGQRF